MLLDLARDIARALRFFSRLPIPPLPGEGDPHAAPDFARLTRVVPVAGAILGALGGLVVLVGGALGLDGLLLGAIAVAALVVATGAFHEDGLADTCDGLGGGRTREQKLEIMKDSRIGSYGACGLILALLARSAAIGTLAAQGGWRTAAILVAAGALSRTGAIWLAVRLPPARADGAAFAAGRPDMAGLQVAAVVALAIGAVTLGPAGGLVLVVLAPAAVAAIAVGMTHLAERQVGGQTGDIAGATQQLAEIAILTVAVMVGAGALRA